MIDKAIVKRSFSRAAATYDAYSQVQKEIACELASLVCHFALSPNQDAAPGACEGVRGPILDIGCGTGSLVRLLKGTLPGARYYGCDIALPMLLKARGANEGATRLLAAAGDLESLPFKKGSFGVAISSLSLQWAPDISRAFAEASSVLRPGGLFIFSTLGPDTLEELRQSYSAAKKTFGLPGRVEPRAAFAGASRTRELLEGAGFEVLCAQERKLIKSYKDMMELLEVLKHVGATGAPAPGQGGLKKASIVKAAARVYAEEFPSPDGGIRATYGAVYAVARKS